MGGTPKEENPAGGSFLAAYEWHPHKPDCLKLAKTHNTHSNNCGQELAGWWWWWSIQLSHKSRIVGVRLLYCFMLTKWTHQNQVWYHLISAGGRVGSPLGGPMISQVNLFFKSCDCCGSTNFKKHFPDIAGGRGGAGAVIPNGITLDSDAFTINWNWICKTTCQVW